MKTLLNLHLQQELRTEMEHNIADVAQKVPQPKCSWAGHVARIYEELRAKVTM